jgi:two-component system chemotaxis response regulator CheY
MKFLIVDDSRAMRMIIARTLKQAGFGDHPVVQASNGTEALEMIQTESPDFVLSDWNMPEMLGIELLQKMREDHPDIRLGFITSESSVEVKTLAKSSGAEFVLTKPFTAETMANTLQPILG